MNDAPVDVVLHCPKCYAQHIDKPDTDAEYAARLHESSWWELGGDKPERWTNPPHRSHLCGACGCLWRPADVPTNGIAGAQTRGKRDTWPPAAYTDAERLLAGRISNALGLDENESYATVGMFGPAMSALIKELASK